ncbi:MAG: hypothetical protein ACOCUV_02420 [bacterium]
MCKITLLLMVFMALTYTFSKEKKVKQEYQKIITVIVDSPVFDSVYNDKVIRIKTDKFNQFKSKKPKKLENGRNLVNSAEENKYTGKPYLTLVSYKITSNNTEAFIVLFSERSRKTFKAWLEKIEDQWILVRHEIINERSDE